MTSSIKPCAGRLAKRLDQQTQRRIDEQRNLVIKLKPGTKAHRIATEVLLLMQDTAYVLDAAQRTIEDAKEASKNTGMAMLRLGNDVSDRPLSIRSKLR